MISCIHIIRQIALITESAFGQSKIVKHKEREARSYKDTDLDGSTFWPNIESKRNKRKRLGFKNKKPNTIVYKR